MATLDLTSDAFWQDRGIHVALPPDLQRPPAGLIETVQSLLPEGGCLFRTSGTTGNPKWVILEKRAFLHSARVVNAHYGITSEDRWLRALPDYHVGGFSIHARCWLSGSKSLFSPEKWSSNHFIGFIKSNDLTITSIVPTQLHDLVVNCFEPPPSLRLLLVGGGRINPTQLRAALDLGWPVCATYGMTETASQVASQPLEHDRYKDPETLEVLPHWDVRVNENETLIVRGPALAKGYVTITAAGPVWEPIDSEFGLVTRDQVQLARNGTRSSLRFLGREQSFLKILGELVHLETLEQRFYDLCPPLFPASALLALPDPRREHVLVLALECSKPPPNVEQLVAAYHQASAAFERIDHHICLPAFPRTGIGKLARAELERQVRATLGL